MDLHGLGGQFRHLVGSGRNGSTKDPGQAAPQDATQQRERVGAHGAAAAVGPTEGAAGNEVEGDQIDGVAALAARGALLEHRTGALEHERLEEEGRGEERGIVFLLGQGAESTHEHRVEAGIGVALLGQLVRHLQRRQPARDAGEVLADGPERIEDLDLVDDVEVAPALPQQRSTWVSGSRRAPNFDVVRRTPLATARPCRDAR